MQTYGYGKTTLISDKSRVYKGGSWADMPYWLSPGTRRFHGRRSGKSTIGFRCAMDRMGSPEGNKRKTGNWFKSKKTKTIILETKYQNPALSGVFFAKCQ